MQHQCGGEDVCLILHNRGYRYPLSPHIEHPAVLCCTPCALLAWKLSQPWQPPPVFEEGPIVGYVTEWDVAYRRNIIVRVVQRRAFSEPPCHLPRILESPVQGCISPRRRYDPTVGRMSRQWSKRQRVVSAGIVI